jgi:RNA polymerase sigma-70 factor (ECF subfamily)
MNTNAVPDETLACEAQAGSMSSFEELVYRYESRIFQFLRCRVGGVHDAQDLTQSVFVRAFRKIGKFNPRYKFATWLFTIARRESISHYRRQSLMYVKFLPEELFRVGDPGREAAWRDAREKLWELARHRLPENQFAALYLRAAEQMSIKDVARALQKTQTHVKVLLHRARRQMVKELAEGSEELAAIRDTAREATDAAVVEVARAESN